MADCQSEPCTRVLVFVQALKKPKNTTGILLVKADTIVCDGHNPLFSVLLGGYYDFGGKIVPAVLERVRQQV